MTQRRQFYKKLEGKTDRKRNERPSANNLLKIFAEEAGKMKGVDLLGQGTIYPDVIESISVHGPSQTIKSHHNVGGLPKNMKTGPGGTASFPVQR
ncbi:MAG: hypothetical protein WDM78_10735 [Puia sp.]